jgi:hypothetical protein
MTFTTVITQADLDAAERALIDAGDLSSITFADQTYSFVGIEDKLARINYIRGQLRAAAGQGICRFAATSKGV